MRKLRTIPIQETANLQKVQKFLESVGRNSKHSKRVYGIAVAHFQSFLEKDYSPSNVESILKPITNGQVNVYDLLDNFVAHLLTKNLSPNAISLYVAAIRSYLGYCDIDVVPSRFKRKVRMPKRLREEAEPLDASDIRKILLSCSNRRLKSYLLCLVSSASRASELLASRIKDFDFKSSPVKLHIRKEYAKTRIARDIYISDEAADYLQKEWLPWKYTKRRGEIIHKQTPDDIVFSMRNPKNPEKMYKSVIAEFGNALKVAGLDQRREDGTRRKIGLHSLRRYAKTVTATQTNTDYSEWLLGHQRSPYWTMKESERKEIYQKQVMPFLTFLDYGALENSSKGILSQLEQKDREISYLSTAIKERDQKYETEMKAINDRMARIDAALNKVQKLEKELGIK